MPPIALMTKEQAMYHLISGYTAKVAGTERGVTEPKATFSACFGEPFMVLHPAEYAEMLGERLEKHGVGCWLVNTGWTGGPFGVGSRVKLSYTRAMLNAVLDGHLDEMETVPDPVFGLHIPKRVPGVPGEILNPRSTWANPADYDSQAEKLAAMFRENFKKYADHAPPEVRAATP
jgi:phosphoenolpyruvate carboxykinase (ATP)